MQTNKSIFVSYGHEHEEIVKRFCSDLNKNGYKTWFDNSEITEGDDWREAITKGILESDFVLAFLSKRSLRAQGVCLDEIAIAVACKNRAIKTVVLEPELDDLIPYTISGIQYCD